MVTPSRLAMARKRRSLTLAELSAEAGVSVRSLTMYENDKQEPAEVLRLVENAGGRSLTMRRTNQRIRGRCRSRLATTPPGLPIAAAP
ncbi:helix-turn-helix domain-containing protein [Catenulispora sp. MAP5-51]|uniref:helix-turn-helix domain-containing protein n=1 Tax=Catenulispora sp. MAP5-51 TaxID=3156298 RepID=UPI0035164410